jgi:two-component system response regulator TctD
MRLLVVEDNVELGELLCEGLEAEAFAVDYAANAQEASDALHDTRYAAVVLDLGLPDRDGAQLLRELRQRRDNTPVLVLTARRDVEDRVKGLQIGADDYLTKPFALEELVARLRALLRRPGEMLGKVLELSNLELDTDGRQVYVEKRPEALSAQELALLELLMRRSGRVVPKKYVEDQLFGVMSEVGGNAVEVAVHRLRKKLETMGAKVEIHTVRGVGYLLAEMTT